MARRYRDPWAKKSKKGMKSLGTMAKVGGVLGYPKIRKQSQWQSQLQ